MLDKTYIQLYAGGREALSPAFSMRGPEDSMGVFPAGSKQLGSWSYLDAGGERGSGRVALPLLTVDNLADLTTKWATLLGTLNALALGARIRDAFNDVTTYAVARPTNGAARELALKFIFRSAATGQTAEAFLPTVNPAKISYDPNYGAKDVVLLTTTEIAAAVTAFNAFPVMNPYDAAYTDTMTLVGAQVVRGFK